MDHISRRQFLAGSSASIALLARCADQNQDTGGSGGDAATTATRTTTPTTQQETSEHGDHEGHGDNHSEEHGGNESGAHGGSHSEDGGHHGSELPDSPTTSADVGMVVESGAKHFRPHIAWIEPGGTVSWRLESGAHSTTAYHPDNDKPLRVPEGAPAWDNGILSEQGTTFEHTFETAGVYDYFCVPHESQGMIGTVVGRPEPSGQPGLESPKARLPEQARRKISELNERERKLLG